MAEEVSEPHDKGGICLHILPLEHSHFFLLVVITQQDIHDQFRQGNQRASVVGGIAFPFLMLTFV
jgi:hypothetical protein